MYWSALLTGLVPAGVVTVTFTVPALAAGTVAVMVVAETAVNVAGAGPKSTAVAPARPVPVIATRVPAAAVPCAGLTPVTAGTAGGNTVVARASGLRPTGKVLVTALVAVLITETVLSDSLAT